MSLKRSSPSTPQSSAKRLKPEPLEMQFAPTMEGGYDFPDFPAGPETAADHRDGFPFFEFIGTGAECGEASPHVTPVHTQTQTQTQHQSLPQHSLPQHHPHHHHVHSSSSDAAALQAQAQTAAAAAAAATTAASSTAPIHGVAPTHAHLHAGPPAYLPTSRLTTPLSSPPQPPPMTAATSSGMAARESGHNSDNSTTAEDDSVSQRAKDRAARNRESSRRAREKAKMRARNVDAQLRAALEVNRKQAQQIEAMAAQMNALARSGGCTMCGGFGSQTATQTIGVYEMPRRS